ncbi:50S ribosomal protein L11, partial [Vibrio parahaemolyticus]
HTGNLTLDQMLEIARTMRPRSQAKALSGTLKEVLGTAQSIGCTVEGQNPHEIIEGVDDGSIEVPEE